MFLKLPKIQAQEFSIHSFAIIPLKAEHRKRKWAWDAYKWTRNDYVVQKSFKNVLSVLSKPPKGILKYYCELVRHDWLSQLAKWLTKLFTRDHYKDEDEIVTWIGEWLLLWVCIRRALVEVNDNRIEKVEARYSNR